MLYEFEFCTIVWQLNYVNQAKDFIPAILTNDFCDFPQSLQTNARIIPQSGHGHFLLNPFQFINYPAIRRCIF
jgi:hypothetical protein